MIGSVTANITNKHTIRDCNSYSYTIPSIRSPLGTDSKCFSRGLALERRK